MQILLNEAESAAVTRAINVHMRSMACVASAMPLEQTEWIDGQIMLLQGILERAEKAAEKEKAQG